MPIVTTYYLDQQLAAAASGGGGSFNPISLNPLLSLAPGVNQYQDSGFSVPAVALLDPLITWVDERNGPGAPSGRGYSLSNSPGQVLYPGAFPGGGAAYLTCGVPLRYLLTAAHSLQDLTFFSSGIYFTDSSQLISATQGAIFNDNQEPAGIALNFGGQDASAAPFKGGLNGWWGAHGSPPAGYQSALLPAPQLGPVPVVLTGQWGASGSAVTVNGVTSAALDPTLGTSSSAFYHGFSTTFPNAPNGVFLRRAYLFSSAGLSPTDVSNVQSFLISDLAGCQVYPRTWPVLIFAGDSRLNGPAPNNSTFPSTWCHRLSASLTNPCGRLQLGMNSGTFSLYASAYQNTPTWAPWVSGSRTRPQLAFLCLGINDFGEGRTGAQVYADTVSLSAYLTSQGMLLCVCVAPPSTGVPFTSGSEYQIYRTMLLADFPTASGHTYLSLPGSGVTYGAALFDSFSDPVLANPSGGGYVDGLHFSATGDAAFAADVAGFTALHGVT